MCFTYELLSVFDTWQGLGDNVYVEYTYDDTSATSFCPAIPVGVVNAQKPYNGYSNASEDYRAHFPVLLVVHDFLLFSACKI